MNHRHLLLALAVAAGLTLSACKKEQAPVEAGKAPEGETADQFVARVNEEMRKIYPELNAAYPLPFAEGLSLIGHVGYTSVREELDPAVFPNGFNGKFNPNYMDWKLGLSYVWKDGWTIGAYYVDANNKDFYKNTASFANSDTKDLARSGGYITIGRTF